MGLKREVGPRVPKREESASMSLTHEDHGEDERIDASWKTSKVSHLQSQRPTHPIP